MSWTDKKAVETILKLRDKFNIKDFVETGAFKGINARFHSRNFLQVKTCESNPEHYQDAIKNLSNCQNVHVYLRDSKSFLERYICKHIFNQREDMPLFFLDAHFYDIKLPKEKRFVVLDELRALEGFNKGVVIIHDFANNLGHITYDGIDLNFDLLKDSLYKVNPNFYYYTNNLDNCDIVKPTIEDIEKSGLIADKETLDNLQYAWSSPRLTYRGILYCI